MQAGRRLGAAGLTCISAYLLTACGNPGPASHEPSVCALPSPGPASGQTLARLGAYYFDGWSGPLSNFHFDGLVRESYLGSFRDREPVTGWQDNNPCAVEQQLAWAHHFGIDFFVFLWYFKATLNSPGENLNSALEITHALRDRHHLQYAILYVNAPPFVVGPAEWSSAVKEWTGYFTDPAYVRVNGKPLFMVIDMDGMYRSFGSATAVAGAFDELRRATRAQGLPGAYIVGGFGVWNGSAGQDERFPDLSWVPTHGYDAVSMYNYPFAPPAVNGVLPFSALSDAGHWIWNQAALKSPLPFIPVAMDGWDPRPWQEAEATTGYLMWYRRGPQEVASLVGDAITWAESNPTLRPESSPTPPLVLIEAWNELGEGSFLVPTVGDGQTYGDALAAMLATTPPGVR